MTYVELHFQYEAYDSQGTHQKVPAAYMLNSYIHPYVRSGIAFDLKRQT